MELFLAHSSDNIESRLTFPAQPDRKRGEASKVPQGPRFAARVANCPHADSNVQAIASSRVLIGEAFDLVEQDPCEVSIKEHRLVAK